MNTIDRITTYVAALGVLLSALAFAASSAVGTGALAGAALALGDWLVTRFLGGRILAAPETGRTFLSLALVAKMGLVLGAVALILIFTHVHPIGFLIGISAMPFGVIAGGLHMAFSATPVAAEPSESK